jgi:hypothetical protein
MEKPGHFTADTFMATVSPRRLRDEMIALLSANTIDPTIADNLQYFVPLAARLTEDISHKPLELTDAKLKAKMEKPAGRKRADVIRSLIIEPNTDPQVKANFVIKADVRRNPPTPEMPGFFLQAPFVIATDGNGNPVA